MPDEPTAAPAWGFPANLTFAELVEYPTAVVHDVLATFDVQDAHRDGRDVPDLLGLMERLPHFARLVQLADDATAAFNAVVQRDGGRRFHLSLRGTVSPRTAHAQLHELRELLGLTERGLSDVDAVRVLHQMRGTYLSAENTARVRQLATRALPPPGLPPAKGEDHAAGDAGRGLLDVGPDATEADVLAAFRARAKELHPDQGGSEEAFRALVHERDERLDLARRRQAMGADA